jgi:hypothetical protein
MGGTKGECRGRHDYNARPISIHLSTIPVRHRYVETHSPVLECPQPRRDFGMGRAGSRYPKCVCPIGFTVWEWRSVRRNHLGGSEVLPWAKPLLQMDRISCYEKHTSGKRHRVYIHTDIIGPDCEFLLVCQGFSPMTPPIRRTGNKFSAL